MKKSDLVLIGAVILVILIGILSTKGTESVSPVEYPVTLYGEPGLKEITYSEYEELVTNNETFIVVIERTGCGYCQMYMPILEEVAEEKKMPILYINTDNLSDEDLESLSTKNAYLKRNSWGTPTTLLMQGERVLDTIDGYVEKDSFLNFISDKIKLED